MPKQTTQQPKLVLELNESEYRVVRNALNFFSGYAEDRISAEDWQSLCGLLVQVSDATR